MTEHYRRGDPEGGCGIMVIAGMAIILLIVVIVIVLLFPGPTNG